MMNGLAKTRLVLRLHTRNDDPAKVNSLDDLLVHQGGAIELGVVEPCEECDLDHVVERDPLDKERHDVFGN